LGKGIILGVFRTLLEDITTKAIFLNRRDRSNP